MKYDKVKRNGREYFRYRHWDGVLRKYDKTIYALKYKDLKEKVEAYENQISLGVADNNTLFSDFCYDWLMNVHLVDKKPTTASRYVSIHKNYIKPARVGKIKLKDLKPADLQKWYNILYEEKSIEKDPNKAFNIVHNLHKVVSPCIRYAFKSGCIVRNIAELVVIPKSRKKADNTPKHSKVHPLTLDEQKSFIAACAGNYYEALFNTALDTGARQGELFALTWGDINFEQNFIEINKTYSYVQNPQTGIFEGQTTDPKTETSARTIPLPMRTREILLKHKTAQKKALLPTGLIQDNETLVFCTPVGTHLDSSNVLKRLKVVYEKAGIKDKVFHDLRHTYATRLFELGEAPKTVQVLLGHSDVNVTLGTYTHVLEVLKKKTASKIDDLYKKMPEENTAEVPDLNSFGQLSDNLVIFPKVSHF